MPILTEKWQQPIRCFQNVSEYKAVEGPHFCWSIDYESESYPVLTTNEIPIYFILDSANHAAFSHWVYENSTWLPIFLEVQKQYPSCFLVLEKIKTYKKLYLDFYGISQECVLVEPKLNKKNVCFFHTYTSLNDKSIPSIYYTNILKYETMFHDRAEKIKEIPLLYLPRGTKENFLGTNNRAYDIQNDLKEYVVSLGGTVYETDTTTRFQDQIDIIQKANVILLDYGSNLWVNGLLAKNSKLVCLNIGWNQHANYPSLGYLWQKIQETNTITQVFAYPSEKTDENGVAIVKLYLPTVMETIQKALEIPW